MKESKPMQAIRKMALQLPEVEESTSCNKAAFKAGKKSFLFMGMDPDSYNLMLKLGDSLGEAETKSAEEPDHYSVGKHGWVSLNLPHADDSPGHLAGWIEESFRLLAPKKLVALLPEK